MTVAVHRFKKKPTLFHAAGSPQQVCIKTAVLSPQTSGPQHIVTFHHMRHHFQQHPSLANSDCNEGSGDKLSPNNSIIAAMIENFYLVQRRLDCF